MHSQSPVANGTHAAGRPTLVIVLGMHRSGTSVTTRLMETMGANFGNKLWPAGPDNPKGFFEDSDVIRLNIDLMEATGVDWQALPPPDFSRLSAEDLEAFQQRALDLLQEKCSGGMLALKDPRIARLLPFWLPVLDRFDARVLYVVPFRHPLSVAKSLEKRNQIPHSKSFMLWLAHVVPSLLSTENRTRALLNYDRLMEAPREELHKLADTLGLPLDPARVQTFEQDFLEKDLRHSTFGFDDLERDRAAPVAMNMLFHALVALAESTTPDHLAAYKTALANAEALLRDVEPMLQDNWKRELDIRELYEVLDGLQKRAVALERGVADAAVREAEVRQALEESQRRLASISDEKTRQVRSLNASHEADVTTIHDLEARLAHYEAELSSLTSSTSWRITAPLRRTRRYFGR
ncbi:hypothetical protein [Paraburkholderia sp. J94]|uniref:sulfotransferase family protein n=1 Tax=Paraburkholderia sp. J94 TaxID=2805441 RepID=UPI002AAF81FE|nr:hypothetical protein [Paraburkholderia sp. J94]